MKLYPDTHYSAALHENDWAQLKRLQMPALPWDAQVVVSPQMSF